jgi:hypothetical protein
MFRKSVAVLSTLALVSVPVAATAHPGHPPHPTPPSPPAKPHKCTPHAIAYRVSGSLVGASLTAMGKHRASGTVTITVTGANRAARNAGVAKGSTQTYTLSNARVSYAHPVTKPNPPAGTRTVVRGTITVVAPKCPDKTGAGQVTIKHVVFTPAHKGNS